MSPLPLHLNANVFVLCNYVLPLIYAWLHFGISIFDPVSLIAIFLTWDAGHQKGGTFEVLSIFLFDVLALFFSQL